MSIYGDVVDTLRAALPPEPGLRDFVRFATLAPNSHNTQPWKFRLGDDTIDVIPDFSRRTPVVDPDDHHLYVTLGCAGARVHRCRQQRTDRRSGLRPRAERVDTLQRFDLARHG